MLTRYALKMGKLDVEPGAAAAMVGFVLNANTIDRASFTVYYGR